VYAGDILTAQSEFFDESVGFVKGHAGGITQHGVWFGVVDCFRGYQRTGVKYQVGLGNESVTAQGD
jgi:hypothetical protein